MDNSTPDMTEMLIRYLDGEMEESEKKQLENAIASDNALQQELDGLKLSRQAVRLYGIRNGVAAVHGQIISKQETPVKKISDGRRILRFTIAVAASIVLIAGIFTIYKYYNVSADRVFDANYYPYELSTARGGGTSESNIEQAYREKKYEEVITLAKEKEDARSLFFSSQANMQIKQYPAAIVGFKKVMSANETAATTLFKDETEYYLALAYIANKDFDLSLALLEKIKADKDHLYHEKATPDMIGKVKTLKWR